MSKKKAAKPSKPMADDAISQAKAELDRAKACYKNVRRQATKQLKNVRKTNVGDIIDGTLETVKRHPAAGLGVAALLGFFLGRLFRH